MRTQICLRTTRIPIFDERRGNPAFGNQGLGLLSSFLPPNIPPHLPINAIDHQSEWALPEVIASKGVWIMLGVRLPYHFLLILSRETTPSLPGSHSPPPDNFLTSSASLAMATHNQQSDPLNTDLFQIPDFEHSFGLLGEPCFL
jgi:hypothetical protein